MISRKTLLFVMIVSFGVNIMEATASPAYYRGFMVKSLANKLTKKGREKSKVEKICQTKILHTFDNTTITEETCIKPKIYLTPTQKMLRRVFAMAVITMAIMGCLNMDSRDREEMFDIWMGMVAADVVDSFFEDD